MSDLNDSLFNSIELENIGVEVADIALDSITEDELILKIPIVGLIVGLYKTTVSIRDRIFLAKMISFLKQLEGVSSIEKVKFVQKINTEPKFKKRVGENLLLIIEKLDDIEKADLLAKVFCEYMVGRIDFVKWQRFANIISNTLLYHILKLPEYYQNNLEDIDSSTLQELYNVGLVSLAFNEYAPFVKNKTSIEFIKILFPKEKDIYSIPLVLPFASIYENELYWKIIEKEIEVYPYSINVLEDLWSEDQIHKNNYYLEKFNKMGLIECDTDSTGIIHRIETTENGFHYYYEELLDDKILYKDKTIKALTDKNILSDDLAKITEIPLRILIHILFQLERENYIELSRTESGAYIITPDNISILKNT